MSFQERQFVVLRRWALTQSCSLVGDVHKKTLIEWDKSVSTAPIVISLLFLQLDSQQVFLREKLWDPLQKQSSHVDVHLVIPILEGMKTIA